MPVICWGALGKSANDPTTIDEQIAADILEHNVDINAHGLNGYAIHIHRNDSELDHLDYSVTGDKITANQIIAKDFRTAQDVGNEQDGVLYNKDGIQMYHAGEQKVNIPVTGDPTFKGKMTIRELKFMADHYFYNFETHDPITLMDGELNSNAGPIVGSLAILPYTGTGNKGKVAVRMKSLVQTNGPFFEVRAAWRWNNIEHIYFGINDIRDTTDEDHYAQGFAIINGAVHAVYREMGTIYTWPIPYFTANKGLFRLETDIDNLYYRWSIDGHVYISDYFFGDDEQEYETFTAEVRNTTATRAFLRLENLGLGTIKG